jgi:hypothetical protein
VFEPRRGWIWSAIGIAAGAAWLSQLGAAGLIAGVPMAFIGGVLLSAGVSQVFWPGDRRVTELAALTGFAGGLGALPLSFVLGPFLAVALSLAALAAAWAAGRMALLLEPHAAGVPAPKPTARLAAKIALDDLILGIELANGTRFAADREVERVVEELEQCRALFGQQGFFEKPDTYHLAPPDLVDPELRRRRVAGRAIEVLRFESGYSPRPGEPGRERWLAYATCREAYAYVLRRPGEGRPWLVCTNGYRMGHAGIDVRVFERFASKLGLNVLIPVLPLHGPRRRSRHSGTGFLGLDVVDTLHAEAQAVWDIRRLLSWIRAQSPRGIGGLGLSLGGYTTSVYAGLVDDLDCVVAGIPLVDIARMLERHAVPHELAQARRRGFSLDHAREVLTVVSPLSFEPRVAKANRMIFGAVADRLVTPDQVRDLWRHWDEPEIVWYQGGHVTFRVERGVYAGIDRTLRAAGLVDL